MEDLVGCKSDEEKININETCKCSEDVVIKEDSNHDEVESTKLEMEGVREENVRLKTLLQQIESDYKALQMRFTRIYRKDGDDEFNKILIKSPILNSATAEEEIINTGGGGGGDDDDDEELELVSLRLGTSPPISDERAKKAAVVNNNINILESGLNRSSCISLTGGKKECSPPMTTSNVSMKTQRSGEDGELISQTSLVKRARVCVRARCDTPTMNDGCQWRKYGQKIAKGNPCPRAYYRCTVSPTCPVRKQVQRCMDDMSILITTYEGAHNHPLPMSATAMASTTSAAASMLLSGSSSTSQPPSATASPPPPPNLYGPPPPSTFRPYDHNSRSITAAQPSYFLPQYNSPSTPFPTITLDLTTNPSAAAYGGFGLYSSTTNNTSRNNNIPRVSPTSLNFSSGGGIFSHGTTKTAFPYRNDQHHYSLLPEKPPHEQHEYRSYLEKFNQASSQQALTETLTKVITSDASFRSVIAAAISTMTANNNGGGEIGGGGPNLKWGGGDQHIPATDPNQLT